MKPKYVNTDDFPKQHTLYNWDRVSFNSFGERSTKGPLIVVESFATVMKLHQCGYPAVATFGATVSENQENLLARSRGPLYLAYDNDVAGQKAARDVAESMKRRANVHIVPPPEGEKADMGDLNGPEIASLINRSKPYVSGKIRPVM